jgi:hypothetical protein
VALDAQAVENQEPLVATTPVLVKNGFFERIGVSENVLGKVAEPGRYAFARLVAV